MRFFVELSYDGSPWHGWQEQSNAATVQGEIEQKLSVVLKTDIKIVGSGRTDAGVHCMQQYFHLDYDSFIDNETFLYKINSFLPESISIKRIVRVKEDSHARFDAICRTYQYIITRKKDPFTVNRALPFFKDLNVPKMNKACEKLVGEKDFQCFSKVKTDVNTFVCNIFDAQWVDNDSRLIFTISANRFLRGMVRAIVGTMLEVGTNKLTLKQFEKIIELRDRKIAGPAVEPFGLYLVKVSYPNEIFV